MNKSISSIITHHQNRWHKQTWTDSVPRLKKKQPNYTEKHYQKFFMATTWHKYLEGVPEIDEKGMVQINEDVCKEHDQTSINQEALRLLPVASLSCTLVSH